ncbi:MAG: cytochrome C [SAR324 cluster bacterium]|uniref:Cytochrome C n=1 Tax=SAR324 cluster bacterium TaxID=2024889 RepID=A0A2A4SNK1_9DELT|nr:MAG: cytochrome C [SAR324 cluster bacterium]
MKQFFKTIFTLSLLIIPLSLFAVETSSTLPERLKTRALAVLNDDCANCHGLYRMGGLGPALTPEKLRQLPLETIALIIQEGIPGKFMPPWKAVLSRQEIDFLAQYIKSTPATPPQIKRIQIRKVGIKP